MRTIHARRGLWRNLLAIAAIVGALVFSGNASAQSSGAVDFIQQKHTLLENLLRQPESAGRTVQLNQGLDSFVDYEELTRRAFGEPCHPSLPNCEDIWATYEDAKKHEVGDLLRQLVRKSYTKNLQKTLDYEITYKATKDVGDDIHVVTEAQNKAKPHEPPIRVVYVVKQLPQGFRVVDIITEGSSLSKNYYDQFRKKMHNPNEGYPNIVAKLKEKIAKKD